MSEKKPIETTEETLHKDPMLTLKRRTQFYQLETPSAEEAEQLVSEVSGADLPSVDEVLCDTRDRWTMFLHEEGWPSPVRLVRVSRDPNGQERWKELPPEDIHNPLALVPTGAGHVEYGAEFIMARAKRLSVPWWLARLSKGVTTVLEEEDRNVRDFLLIELGREQRKFEEHHAHLDDLVYGLTAKRQRQEGGRTNRSPDHDLIVKGVQERVDAGKSHRQAAEAVFRSDGLGASGPGNLKIWQREKQRQRKCGRS